MVLNTQSQENELQVNTFYRDHYRRTMKWLVFMVVVCAILSVILIGMTYQPRRPDYYAAMTSGEVVPMHALSEPIVTDDFVLRWSELAARRVYNLSFSNYQNELNELQDKFTPQGWANMIKATQSLVQQIVDSRLIITAVVSGPPVVLARMIIHGRYTWRIQMKLLVTYTSASATSQRTMVITMNVQRVPTLNTPQGIQIIDFTSGYAQ